MNPTKLALQYMDTVFYEKDLDKLRPLLADSFVFEGPFYTFNTAEAYINSLKTDPPAEFKYEILRSWEDEHGACLIYRFAKPGISTLMSQWFEVKAGKITKTLLIFDSGVFNN